jgi:dolichol-phosphate mannosyltransferase
MEHNIKLGIVTPFANERSNAEDFVAAVLAVCARYSFRRVEMYAVLDKVCTDGTYDILRVMAMREPRLQVIWAPENRCVVDAYMRGYRQALERGNDWILEIDAGFSHDPEQIPLLFSEMANARDCVFGVRFGLPGARFEGGLKRRLISQGGSALSNMLLGTKLGDMTGGFELFSHKALEYILKKGVYSRGPFFQTEIRTHAHAFNFGQVPIRYCSPSHNVNGNALREAFMGLWRLYREKKGQRSEKKYRE